MEVVGHGRVVARWLFRLLLATGCGLTLLLVGGTVGGVAVASALTFDSAMAGHNAVATSLTVTAPAGTSSGDVMIASIDANASPTVTPPSGWTLVRRDTNSASTHMSQSLYWHAVGSSEPAAYTWQFSAKVGAGGSIADYRGADASNPVDVSGGQASLKSAQIIAPSLNVAGAGELLVGSFAYSDTGQIGAPAGMTARISDTSSNPPGERTTLELADQGLSAGGATGSRTDVLNQAANGIGQLAALRPDVTPPSAPAQLAETGSTGSSITLTWAASTDNDAVTGYAVYQAGVLVTNVTGTSYTLGGLSCGSSYSLSVKAYDPSGNYSAPIGMSAATAACPVSTGISIAAPAAGSTVSGGNVAITATTTGSSPIQYVQFELDGNLLGAPVSNSPYTLNWDSTSVADGPHVLTAVGTDATGNAVTSAPVNVTVNNTPAPTPTAVSITGPSDGSTVSGPGVAITAATTGTAAIQNVQFELDGNPLQAPVTSSPYTINWDSTSVADGSHVLTAVATDASGNAVTSAPINVTVSNTPLPTPTGVSITSPSGGSTVSGSTVAIAAATTGSAAIQSVQFQLDGNPLQAPVTSSPYTINWDSTSVADGPHLLTALATDASGNSVTSAPVNVTVANTPPTVASVTINQTAPTTNSLLDATVAAHDPAGLTLAYHHQWFANGTAIQGATGAKLDLSGPGNGDKGDAISLQVTANDGAHTSPSVTSNPVTIQNSAPVAQVALSSSTPDTDATVTATSTPSDADGDPVTQTFVWSVNGTTVKTTSTSGTSDSLDLSVPGHGNYGDGLTVSVTPNDGTVNGAAANAIATVTKPSNGTILEYGVAGAALPSGLSTGPDGNLWFTVEGNSNIGRVTPAGTMSLFSVLTPGNLGGINPGPDGNMWFTEFNGNKIGRITTTGSVTEFPVSGTSGLGGIVAGSDGNMWFMDTTSDMIGKITMAGVITQYKIPTANALPHGPNLGPDGDVWFNEFNTGKIAKITPSGVITEYKLPSASSQPDVIAAGPDGNLWFTEYNNKKVGRITTGGAITEFPLPNGGAGPVGITTGPDGNLWFTERTSNRIARMSAAGVITEYPVPTAGGGPDKIVAGPDGNLWFTEHNSAKISRITP